MISNYFGSDFKDELIERLLASGTLGKNLWFVVYIVLGFAIWVAPQSAAANQVYECEDGQQPNVKVRLDTGVQLSVHPQLLIGNSVQDMLQDPEVVCGDKGILISSLRLPVLYLTAQGVWDGGDWGDATPPNLNLTDGYGSALTYKSDREWFDRYKLGNFGWDRLPAFCTTEANGFEYCSTCIEDADRPGFCRDSEIVIRDFYFKILDRRPITSNGAEKSLLISCDAIRGSGPHSSRICRATYAMKSGQFVHYEFGIRASKDIFEFDFGAYHEKIQTYLDTLIEP